MFLTEGRRYSYWTRTLLFPLLALLPPTVVAMATHSLEVSLLILLCNLSEGAGRFNGVLRWCGDTVRCARSSGLLRQEAGRGGLGGGGQEPAQVVFCPGFSCCPQVPLQLPAVGGVCTSVGGDLCRAGHVEPLQCAPLTATTLSNILECSQSGIYLNIHWLGCIC